MGRHYARIAFTPAVRAEQALIGSAGRFDGMRQAGRDDARLGPEEAGFIAAQRGFVLASVSATGWPYVQHRGGSPGFVQATPAGDAVAFADLPGNRQHVTLGNLAGDDRVALLFLDHAARRRLKLFGHARLERGGGPADDSAPRRILVQVEGWEWNCPQHIPRLLPAEAVAEALDGAAAPDPGLGSGGQEAARRVQPSRRHPVLAPHRAGPVRKPEEARVNSTLLLIVLIVVLLAVLPTWPYSAGFGYFPSGIVGLIVVVLLVMVLTGRL